MNDKEIKLECARQAIHAADMGSLAEGVTILDFAKQIYEFVSEETAK